MRYMKSRVLALAAVLTATTGLIAGPALAMGSGNPYVDQQVGVGYTVYQPMYTAGLKTPTTANNPTCPEGTDQSLLVAYGKKSTAHFTVTEGKPMCADIGEGTTVLTTTVKGAKAVVVAYCDPAKACTKADVKKYGGNLNVTLPAVKPLSSTIVWVETTGKHALTANQLVLIAQSMRPVG